MDRLLHKYGEARKISLVYEAGYFGFWLYDMLFSAGFSPYVTPPSQIPKASGNRVKTDKMDSNKLAEYLQSRILKKIYVPSLEERAHRSVARRRRQLIGDRVRVQQRIKADMRFYGMALPDESTGKWSKRFVENLWKIKWSNRYLQESFQPLLEEYDMISSFIGEQTALLKELSQTEIYKDRVEILTSAPGIGFISAMEILLELQSVERFRRADQLAAYVGLTPTQHSTGAHIRMGHITKNSRLVGFKAVEANLPGTYSLTFNIVE